mgnify:CR=1 FL=1
MPGLIVWKNQEINKLRRDMERLFDRLWDEFPMPRFPQTTREIPFIDISETVDTLIIRAEVPGIIPEDLDISMTEDILAIKGTMEQDAVHEGENYHRTERRYGSFSRTLQLPCRIKTDDVRADYQKGIITIIMPKCKPNKPREVKIIIK